MTKIRIKQLLERLGQLVRLHLPGLTNEQLGEEPLVQLSSGGRRCCHIHRLTLIRYGQRPVKCVLNGFNPCGGSLDLGFSIGNRPGKSVHLGSEEVDRYGTFVMRVHQLGALVYEGAMAFAGSLGVTSCVSGLSS